MWHSAEARATLLVIFHGIYTTTQRDAVDFHLALIGNDFTEPYTQAFDQSASQSGRCDDSRNGSTMLTTSPCGWLPLILRLHHRLASSSERQPLLRWNLRRR
jgi:hypothetical protein